MKPSSSASSSTSMAFWSSALVTSIVQLLRQKGVNESIEFCLSELPFCDTIEKLIICQLDDVFDVRFGRFGRSNIPCGRMFVQAAFLQKIKPFLQTRKSLLQSGLLIWVTSKYLGSCWSYRKTKVTLLCPSTIALLY